MSQKVMADGWVMIRNSPSFGNKDVVVSTTLYPTEENAWLDLLGAGTKEKIELHKKAGYSVVKAGLVILGG